MCALDWANWLHSALSGLCTTRYRTLKSGGCLDPGHCPAEIPGWIKKVGGGGTNRYTKHAACRLIKPVYYRENVTLLQGRVFMSIIICHD